LISIQTSGGTFGYKLITVKIRLFDCRVIWMKQSSIPISCELDEKFICKTYFKRYGAGVVTPLAVGVGAVGNWRRPQEARQLLTAPKQQMAGLFLICNPEFIYIGLTDQAE